VETLLSKYSGIISSWSCFDYFKAGIIQGLIFVVDSNDRERIGEAKDELSKMVKIEINNMLICVVTAVR